MVYLLETFVKKNDVELVIVSHIEALKDNVADLLRKAGHLVLGVSGEATILETSKRFCKELCIENQISTPKASYFYCEATLRSHLYNDKNNISIIKVDWLTKNGNGAILVNGNDDISRSL